MNPGALTLPERRERVLADLHRLVHGHLPPDEDLRFRVDLGLNHRRPPHRTRPRPVTGR